MKQEDKDLLLKDLCARLPYGVKGMLCEDCICTLDKIWTKKGYELVVFAGDYYDVECFKPYLFPLLRMTKEQKKFFDDKNIELDGWGIVSKKGSHYQSSCYTDIEDWLEVIDWLNKNHFDYRGLINKGLAIDATGLNVY